MNSTEEILPEAIPTLLKKSRYDYAMGKVEVALGDSAYPQEGQRTGELFKWVGDYVNKEKKTAVVRSRYEISMGAEIETPGSSVLTLTVHDDLKMFFWECVDGWAASILDGPSTVVCTLTDLFGSLYAEGKRAGAHELRQSFHTLLDIQ